MIGFPVGGMGGKGGPGRREITIFNLKHDCQQHKTQNFAQNVPKSLLGVAAVAFKSVHEFCLFLLKFVGFHHTTAAAQCEPRRV